MTQPPSAIDQMIWQLAESGDMVGYAEFVSQYPEFKDELEHRAALVQRLRTLKPSRPTLPQFVPSTDLSAVSGQPKWVVPVAAAIVLAGVAYASFAGWRFLQQGNPAPIVEPARPPVQGAAVPRSATATERPAPTPNPREGENIQPGIRPRLQAKMVEDPPAAPPSRWDTRVTVVGKRSTLATVVLSVASGAHVVVELAPGMLDPVIDVEYHDQPAGEVLQDLGRVFGFSVAFETDRKAILIPAVDKSQAGKAPVGKATPTAPAEVPPGALPPLHR